LQQLSFTLFSFNSLDSSITICFCSQSLATFFFASFTSFVLFISVFTSSLCTFSNRAVSTSTFLLLLLAKSVVSGGVRQRLKGIQLRPFARAKVFFNK
jgi:hypothetical protein